MALRKPPARDPNAPKRNMSAYLLYQNAMRDTFKLQNPGMTFGQLAKYTSAMYAEMPPQEKEAWMARAEADKARYLHELSNYAPPPGYDVKGDMIAPASVPGATGRSGKTARDPNAPKRNMSAYLMFQNCMREQFKAENPGMTFGQLAKYTSHMYKSLTPEEKARWESHAQQDKVRYENEMASYVPPPGYDSQGTLVAAAVGTRKYKKAGKDPNAPKRARGSFVFFTFEARPQIMKEMPGIKFTELGTVMGERWRALTPEAKSKFEDQANEDKKRFNEEMQAYQAHKVATAPPVPVPKPAAPVHPYHHQVPHPQYVEHAAAQAQYPEQYYQGHYADPHAQHQAYADYYAQHGQQYAPQGPYQYS